jgi:hypothetical protein
MKNSSSVADREYGSAAAAQLSLPQGKMSDVRCRELNYS